MENKKTIVIFSCFYEPFMSGAERFAKEVSERLKENNRIFIICAKLDKNLADEEEIGGIKVFRVGKGDKFDKIRYIWLACKKAKELRPDIIHAVMESYAGLALWLARYRVNGVKRILTLQSGDLDAKIWSKIPFLWKGIHRSPDFVTAISSFLAERAKRLGAKNIEIVPNGVDFTQITQVLKTESARKHKIICIARLSWEKDHKNLIKAMPQVLDKFSDAELVLVGDGPLRKDIENQIKELNLQDKVELKGNLSHNEAMDELSRADIAICPSLAEGLGIVFIEAQAIGVPVIGTRVGGIPDVIEHLKTGILIEPNNSKQIAWAIIKFFKMEKSVRDKIIQDAKISALRGFNWDFIADKMNDIYFKNSRSGAVCRDSQKAVRKILIATGIYPPDIGGPATYVKLLERELPKRGFNVKVLTYSSSPTSHFERSCTQRSREISHLSNTLPAFISRKLPPILRHFAYFLKVLKLGRKADIIYVQDSVSAGFPTALANLFLRKKLILKVVGDYAWEIGCQTSDVRRQTSDIGYRIEPLDNFYPFDRKKHQFKIWLLHKLEKWVAKKTHKIITPSFYLKGILTNGWKIQPEKIKVIYNSFNPPTPRQNPPSNSPLEYKRGERVSHSSPCNQGEVRRGVVKFKILSVGRLVPWKGFGTLIEIMRDIPNVELEIAGEGDEYNNYQLLITNYKLNDQVKLLGRLSHEDVLQRMRLSDLFILNTAYEGLSHVVLEAMACELPVAISRAGGNTELAGENQERGCLFEYNNKEQIKEKIIHIISNYKEVCEKSKKAKEFVLDFNEEKMLSKLKNEL